MVYCAHWRFHRSKVLHSIGMPQPRLCFCPFTSKGLRMEINLWRCKSISPIWHATTRLCWFQNDGKSLAVLPKQHLSATRRMQRPLQVQFGGQLHHHISQLLVVQQTLTTLCSNPKQPICLSLSLSRWIYSTHVVWWEEVVHIMHVSVCVCLCVCWATVLCAFIFVCMCVCTNKGVGMQHTFHWAKKPCCIYMFVTTFHLNPLHCCVILLCLYLGPVWLVTPDKCQKRAVL